MIYELREYKASENKIEALHKRFQKHTLRIFEKYGIEVIGFWTQNDEPSTLIYLCRFKDEKERNKAWKSFGNDAEWKKIKEDSESDGALTVSKNSLLLDPVTYTPQP
jgi:hypothetical protein